LRQLLLPSTRARRGLRGLGRHRPSRLCSPRLQPQRPQRATVATVPHRARLRARPALVGDLRLELQQRKKRCDPTMIPPHPSRPLSCTQPPDCSRTCEHAHACTHALLTCTNHLCRAHQEDEEEEDFVDAESGPASEQKRAASKRLAVQVNIQSSSFPRQSCLKCSKSAVFCLQSQRTSRFLCLCILSHKRSSFSPRNCDALQAGGDDDDASDYGGGSDDDGGGWGKDDDGWGDDPVPAAKSTRKPATTSRRDTGGSDGDGGWGKSSPKGSPKASPRETSHESSSESTPKPRSGGIKLGKKKVGGGLGGVKKSGGLGAVKGD
jgi:hypothetical protein